MPVVTCTKCPTQLRVPEGATGNVKCPKCQNIFAIGAKAAPAPAFEVVDEAPAKPATAARPAAAPVARPAPPPPPPAAKKGGPEADFDFDDDDAPRKKRGRRDDDDDDDRDRDRPRSRRRRDDDDDDDRDRPRRKRGRRDRDDDYDDDDDDYDRRPAGKSSGYGPAKTGVLLIAIGQFLYVGMYGLLALFALLGMATSVSEGLFAIPGICGCACTILLLIGVSFCIAGPQRGRGMAIATVSVAGVHLVLLIICYSKVTGFGGGFGAMGGGVLGGGEWMVLGSLLWVLDLVLPLLIYAPKGASLGGEGILFLLAAFCELARCILVCLTVRALATAAKDYHSAEKAGMGIMLTSVLAGVAAVFVTLLVVIVIEGKMMKSAQYLAGLGAAAVCTAYALMTLPSALAALGAKDSLARRARRG